MRLFDKVGVSHIEDKMHETQIKWFVHMRRKPIEVHVRRVNREHFSKCNKPGEEDGFDGRMEGGEAGRGSKLLLAKLRGITSVSKTSR